MHLPPPAYSWHASSQAGNFAADIADMAGHVCLARWLRLHASPARAQAAALLGLPCVLSKTSTSTSSGL